METDYPIPNQELAEPSVPVKSLALKNMLSRAAGLFLFFATASVVWWQNSRLTVLYDLSGVLEPAFRITQGDLPYLDFPFPYAPLTFMMQAAVIRLTGVVYWHHIAYCCLVAALATVLAWRILANLLSERVPYARITSFLLAMPMTVLGVYCVFPHPFYDPDAAFIMLLCIYLLLKLERCDYPALRTLAVGALLVVPLFIKQNIGLAFLGSLGIAFLIMTVMGWRRKTPVRGYLLLVAGSMAGLGIALGIVHWNVGIENYKYWTLTFAALRRTPSIADMFSVYSDRLLPLWTGWFLAGAFLMRQNAHVRRWPGALSVLLMAIPVVWPAVYLLLDQDASERAERLVGLWPLMFIVTFAMAYVFVRRLDGIAAALPFVLIATSHGVFLSQQLWGSTYGIWPLLVVLIGLMLVLLWEPSTDGIGIEIPVLAGIISATMLVAGGVYIYSNERLDYVNFEDGEMTHSNLPQIQGLSMRGDWIPDFEELVKYTDENIPRDAGVLYLPGEDLFYYTTGRHPHFPVMLFDVTNNPYDAAEIRSRVMASDIEWIIVKNDTEIEADSMIDSKTAIFDLLKPDFRNVESLNNYEIYKRRHADDPSDEDDDSSSDEEPSDDDGN
ncbi:hypothetical protein BH10ACI3_BH10ACI3_20590 [soil metagenome]